MQLPYLSYSYLAKHLKLPASGCKLVRIALLADFASQHYAKAVRAALIASGFDGQTWEADYNSVEASIINQASELYSQEFDYILIVPSTHKLHKEFSRHSNPSSFAIEKSGNISALVNLLLTRTRSKVILTNYHELEEGVFGNFANKTDQSLLFQLRSLNLELMKLAQPQSNLFIADAQNLYTQLGSEFSFDPKLYIHGDLAYSLDFLAALAQSTAKIIAAVEGSFRKCVVVDLDNTLWGGIIGDDGMENIQIGDLGLGKAFTGLQNWLLSLKKRGIILAVCSKNNEQIAKEVFEKHPAMTLRMDDISVFVANWETKVDNIRYIRSVLNIGFDAMVFLDDNPFERDMVKQHIPGILVPELPEDPAEYLFYLRSLNLFETATFSQEDGERTRQYQQEASRITLQKSFTSEKEFLASLGMQAAIAPADSFTAPRVAQLSQRSNQFNLRTIRYTDQDIRRIMVNPDFYTLTISLSDVYGDYGLISAVIMQKISADTLFIDTWIMSCRVLKRGVEQLVLNEIIQTASDHGFHFVEGEYLPTSKNEMVKDHYAKLGFKKANDRDRFIIDTAAYKPIENQIQKNADYVNDK